MEDFSLWLEFEAYGYEYPAPDDDPECDFCNVQIRVGSRLYAANVWTFGYLPRARMENEVGEPLSRPAAWLVAPDMFVSRLDRPTISAAVSDLITHGGLPSNWLVASSE